MAWLILVVAGLLEVCWSLGLKYADGFTKFMPSLFTIITLALSMFMLAKAVQVIPIGTAYPIWVGIGALGAAIGGIFLFQEEVTLSRVAFLILLVISIIGLKLTSKVP